MSFSKWNIWFLFLTAVQWSNHHTVVANVYLDLLKEHVALDDFRGWRNQSDLPNALHNLTSSLSEEIISFKWRCCLLYKCNVMSLKFTYYACWFSSLQSVNICIIRLTRNKSSTTKILLCFYSNKHEEN